MSSHIKDFNEIMSNFLIQLSPIIGSTYSYEFNKIIKYNALLPIEQFCCHALPLSEKIRNKDETYFVNIDDHNNDIKNDVDILNEILKLKDIYNKLNNESKENIWEIFNALLILSEEYVTSKYIK
jgi:hypothetical protein